MVNVLEQGNVYFFYRPKVRAQGKRKPVAGVEDVQRLFMILSPRGKKLMRLAVLGRKRLPEVENGGERFWGFVDRVVQDGRALQEELAAQTYETKTRGRRERPAARPAGEGVYSLIRHDKHTHFAYALELPKKSGEVQQEFNIEDEASYIISVKNPEKPSPRGAGLPKDEKVELPKQQQQRFRGRRFIDPDPPDVLDHAGTEFILVGAREDPQRELGVDLQAEDETATSAEIFRELHLRRDQTPVAPLFKGEWQ